MEELTIFFLTLLFTITIVTAKNAKQLEYLETEEEFYDAIQYNRNNLILFSKLEGRGCKDCKKSLEVVERTAKEFKGECSFLFVDCDFKSPLHSVCVKYEINKYPTISLISEALAVYPYTMAVTPDKLTNFIKRYSIAKTTIVTNEEEVDRIVKENRVVVVAFFADPTDFPYSFSPSSGATPSTPSFDDLVRSFRRTAAYLLHNYYFVEFVVTSNTVDLLDKYNATLNSVVLFKQIAGHITTNIYTGHISRKLLKPWILDHAPALLYSATSDNFERLKEAKLPIFTVYFYKSEKSEGNIDVYFDLQSAAELLQSSFSFAYFSLTDEDLGELANLKRLGYEINSLPVMTIFNPFSKDIYLSHEKVTTENIQAFASSYLDGKIVPHRVKQSLPEDNPHQLVKVVVYDNYKDIVQNTENDVAIVFYLPEENCRHCGAFLHTFEQAAKIIDDQYHSSYPHLIFAKMDMFANQIAPGIRIRNFPSLLFFARDNKHKEVLFTGKRTVENVVDWILLQTSASKPTEEIDIVSADL